MARGSSKLPPHRWCRHRRHRLGLAGCLGLLLACSLPIDGIQAGEPPLAANEAPVWDATWSRFQDEFGNGGQDLFDRGSDIGLSTQFDNQLTTLPRSDAESTPEERAEDATQRARRAFKGLFYQNDFRYLDDPDYDGALLGDELKRLEMPGDGKLDLGGEFRLRFHDERNIRPFGLTGRDDRFLLTRGRLFANYEISDTVRVFAEYLYAESSGQTFQNRVLEVNRGEAQNLFIDLKLINNDDRALVARLGRQEMLYGNQRLIAPLDWANTRRTFDGYRMLYSSERWDVDGFFVHPLRRLHRNQGTMHWDGADTDTLFYGIYTGRKDLPVGRLERYYLGVDYLTPGSSLHTMGSRLSGSDEAWLYEVEGGVQFGKNQDGSGHLAGFVAGGIGRTLDLGPGVDWQPVVWCWYDYASGERSFEESGRFGGGFDHLFPLAHRYNGLIDLFGRRNLHDVNAQLILPLFGDRASLLLWYHYFFLDRKTTPYNVNLTPFNRVAPAAARELGHELDVLLTFEIMARSSMLFGYSFFIPGAYYSETSGGVAGNNGIPSLDNAQFFYTQYQLQF